MFGDAGLEPPYFTKDAPWSFLSRLRVGTKIAPLVPLSEIVTSSRPESIGLR
jgi:hypothetical protein